jgi:hypothetical protein
MGAKRPDVDWVAVQALYRTDQLSTREIARRYGISDVAILARAKKECWVKDLSSKVATGIREAVISASLANSPAKHHRAKERTAKQVEVVQAAIEEGKLTVLRHIEFGKLLGDNGKRLAEIIKTKIEAMESDPENTDEGLLFTLARAHESIVRAAANTVEIDRKSRGLDDLPSDPSAPPNISIVYYRSEKVLQLTNGREPPHEISDL